MNLCGACDRLSKAISRNKPIRKQYHGQTINLLSSEWTCSLCSFLCSCSVHRNVEDKDYPILRNVLKGCGPFDEKHYITYSIFSEKCSFIIRTPSSAYNCIILISADLDSPATSAGWRLPPTLRPDSSRADHFAFVRSWLAGCLTHSRCKRKRMYYHGGGSSTPVVNEESGPELPSRIIEIRSSHSTPSVRLRETHGLCGQYVALSHCWGPPDKRPLCTTKSNLASLLEEIPFESLPSTFRDAVELTYEIGLQYLWIDSLCIIQDDEEDWRIQSATMGDVYENATLTIGAASAENATEGLFKPIRQRQTPVTIPYYEDHTGEASQGFLIAEEAFNCSPYRSPLRNRGWVVQERILSRRLVSFTRAGLSWKCQESCLDQFGDQFYDQDYWQWIPLMQDYSYCQFTYESDRLIALEGLVNAMKRCERVPYYFGVWYGESVAPTILWMRNIFSPSVNDLPHIPSWSWASKFGPKSFFDSFVHYENDDIFWHPTELIDIEETGLMTISEAPMMLCGTGGFPDSHPKDQNLETIADLLLRIRSEPLSGIQSFHGDMKRLVGVAALDNESIHPSCCVSLLRWKTEFEYFGYNGLPKSHDPDKTMRPDNTGYEPMEHYKFYGLYKSEEEYEFEREYQNFERVGEPKETGEIFPRSEFLKFTSQYWHVVLMLQPADQGENYFHRVGIGIIPENLWKKEEIRYSRIHLV